MIKGNGIVCLKRVVVKYVNISEKNPGILCQNPNSTPEYRGFITGKLQKWECCFDSLGESTQCLGLGCKMGGCSHTVHSVTDILLLLAFM